MKKLVLLFLLTATTALAATWKAEGPYFGVVTSIALDPANPDHVWAATHGGGVWRSDDGGKSWRLAGKELSDRAVSFVMLQPKSSVLWAGVDGGGLARSKDGGTTWTWMQDDLAQTPHPLAFDPANPKSIWIPDVNLHKRSSDGGTKWTEFRISGGDVSTFAFHPTNSKVIWAGGVNGRSGVWRTSDGGASWKQLGKGLPESNHVTKILVDPSQPDTLYLIAFRGAYKSTDGGESWAPFGGAFPQNDEIESLTMSPASPQTLYAGTHKGLLRSTDGAETWTRCGGGLPRYIVAALAINPAAPESMLAATSGAGIYKTSDGGKTWMESNGGFAASWIENVWGNTSGGALAQASRGLFRADGKGGWVEILQPISDDKATLDAVLFDAKNPKLLYGGYASSYYRSQDGGATWSQVEKSFQEPRPMFGSVVIDAKNPKIVYSADHYPSSDEPPIFRSTDGGVVSKPASRGVPPGTHIAALRADASGALLALGKDGGLWRSTDGAATWTAAGGGLPQKELKTMAVDGVNVYVAAKDGLYRSEDGGATFTRVAKGLEKLEIEGVAVDAKGNVYAATVEGVKRSSDNGKSWTAFNDGLTNADVRAIYSAGTRLFAGTAGGGVFSIDLE